MKTHKKRIKPRRTKKQRRRKSKKRFIGGDRCESTNDYSVIKCADDDGRQYYKDTKGDTKVNLFDYWNEKWDEKAQASYWYNSVTGEATWNSFDRVWVGYWDVETQAKYWYNSETGEATWINPFSTPTKPVNWVEYEDEETKKKYWFNILTGETILENPFSTPTETASFGSLEENIYYPPTELSPKSPTPHPSAQPPSIPKKKKNKNSKWAKRDRICSITTPSDPFENGLLNYLLRLKEIPTKILAEKNRPYIITTPDRFVETIKKIDYDSVVNNNPLSADTTYYVSNSRGKVVFKKDEKVIYVSTIYFYSYAQKTTDFVAPSIQNFFITFDKKVSEKTVDKSKLNDCVSQPVPPPAPVVDNTNTASNTNPR